MTYSVKKWHIYQHYKDRKPPWIKLYRDLLDQPEWFSLSGDEAKTLINLWLIASESEVGQLPDSDTLAFRLRINKQAVDRKLKVLVSQGYLINDSKPLSICKQDAIPERERELEIEVESEVEIESVFGFYKETCYMLPQLRDPLNSELGRTVAKQIKERTKGNKLSLADWQELFGYVSESDFLTGKNDRGWKASLDWIVKKENFGKVLSKKYTNKRSTTMADIRAEAERVVREIENEQ